MDKRVSKVSSEKLWAAAVILGEHYGTGEAERTEDTTRRMFEAAGFETPDGWPDAQGVTYGICGVCGRETRVRHDGRLWRHGNLTENGPRNCSGSHSMPERIVR